MLHHETWERRPDSTDQVVVDLGTLSTQQLSQVKKSIDDEVQHLTGSYQNLRTAQQKFRDCITSVKDGVVESARGAMFCTIITTGLY